MFGEAFGMMFKSLKVTFVAAVVMLPLAIWKLVDISIWIYNRL